MFRLPSLRMATVGVVLLCTVSTVGLATLQGQTTAPPVRDDGRQRAVDGGAVARDAGIHAVTLDANNKPLPTVQANPTELRLQLAQSSVFDARKLHGTVVRIERSEDGAPGEVDSDAAAGTDGDAAPATDPDAQPVDPDAQPDADQEAPSTGDLGQVSQTSTSNAPAPAPTTTFAGLDFATWGAGHPPDTNGDVGPTYYIQTINSSIGIYDKSTGTRVAAFTFNAFMSQGSFGNLCDTNNFGDPVVLYDTYEDRWFVTDFAFTLDASGNISPQTAYQCFAVSKTGDPVNGGWNFYSVLDPGGLGDYPKFGIWPDGIYMSANMFGYTAGASYISPHVWAINKAQMYAGAPSVSVVDFAGPSADFTILPSNSRLQSGTPSPGTPEYFVGTEEFLNGQTVYKFHVDWDKISTSTFTGPFTQLAPTCWPAATPPNAPTPANSADVLPIRAMAQVQYTNIGGAESLWVAHSVRRFESANNTTCNAATSGSTAVRWYQLNVTGGTIAANNVQGRTWDPDATNTFYRFMPSLAVDRMGDMAVGYSKSNATTNPQIKYAGRLAGDPLNTFSQGEQTLIDGTGAQSGNCGSAACIRWGDYSGMALDPDGCRFWETNEYYITTGLNHQTEIGSFSFPGCTTVGNGTLSGMVTDGANPISGATVTLGSRTTTTNGSGSYSFTIPAGTYPVMTAATPGFALSSAATLVVPNGGTLTKNFTLVAAAQSGSFVDTTKGDFQGGVPTKADLTTTPGAVVLADPDSSAAGNTNVSPTGFAFTNTNWAGQTFSPTSGGVLKRIDLELFCASCTALSPNITVSIRNTTGSPPVPTGPDLATATIAGFNDLGAGGLKTATFAPGFQMNPGFTYALVFRLVSLFASGNVAYTCSCVTTGFVDSNPYASGQRVTSSNSGANWTADTNMGGRDLNFNIWVNNGFQSPGTFVSSVKDANPAPGKSSTWGTLSWAPTTQPSQTFLSMQAAASDSIYGPFNFVGPDGTGHTTFTNGGSLAQFNGKRYLRYRANLTTTLGTATPTLSDVTIGFSDVVPTGAATLMTVSSATGDFGDFVNLSTTLTSNGNPVAGRLVSFELNGADAGSATTNGSGVASLNNVSLAVIPVGSYPTGVSASWAGDASFLASSGSAQLTVNQAGTSTGVSSSFNPSVVSQPVSFTANVVNGAGIPTGTVQFKIDGVNFGSAVTLDGTGNAVSATTTTLALGNRSVSAVYSGSSTFLPSTGSTTQTVTKAPASIMVTSNHNPAKKGTKIIFTVTAAPAGQATATPTGKVKLFANGVGLGTKHALVNGQVAITVTWTLAKGTFNITAKYFGSTTFVAVTGPPYQQVITR